MNTVRRTAPGRFLAVVVAALLAVLVAPGTANASIGATTTAAFSGAVPISAGAGVIRYCGGPLQPACSGTSYAQVTWGTGTNPSRLAFLPAGSAGGQGTAESGEPFRLGDVNVVNTRISQASGIRSVRLTLSLDVTDADRGATFTASMTLPLEVVQTDNDGPDCPFNPAPPCSDAILMPPAPAVPIQYDAGGAVYQVDVLGFGSAGNASGSSSRLVAPEDGNVLAPLMARVVRTVPVAADAGPDQEVAEGSTVTLDGSGSQGVGLTYAWRQIAGPAMTLDDPSSTGPSFTAGPVAQDESLEFELTVTDPLDPSAQATDTVVVTVRNVNRPPVLSLPDPVTVTATGADGAVVTYEVDATDPDGGEPVVVCTPASGTAFPVGSTTVTCTATDVDGAVVTGSFAVRVNAPPELQLPADLTVDATMPAGASVTYQAAATDDGGTADVGCTPESGTTFAVGTTTVDCTATDDDGATATGSFDVTVRGAREQLADLLVAVAGLGPGRSLEAKIRAAVAWLPDRALPLACDPLRAFVGEVQAQSGKRIPADTAALLIDDATRIRAVLACR